MKLWLIVVALCVSCAGEGPGETCELQTDLQVHCRCNDPSLDVADAKPWPCGYPDDGDCQPTNDCDGTRECLSSDGSLLVTIEQTTLTVRKVDGSCVDTHSIVRR